MKTLVIGGTARARRLATRLARHHAVIYSLAGVTEQPRLPQGCTVRRGPFGGVDGLVAYLRTGHIEQVIDGSHPHAVRISRNVEAACARCRVPRSALRWRRWHADTGDQWTAFTDINELSTALAARAPSRVLLALGAQASKPLLGIPGHHYLWRCVEPPANTALPPHSQLILARGPFTQSSEQALLEAHRIDLIVCKNSGLSDGRAKLHAARTLGIEAWLLDPG